jgi:PAS domain S-box-containing protein
MPGADPETLPSALFRRTRLGVVHLARTGEVLFANAAAVRMLAGPSEGHGLPLLGWPRLPGTALAEAIAGALGEGRGFHLAETPVKSLDEETPRYLDAEGVPLDGEGTTQGGLLLLVTDATDRVGDHERARLFQRAFLHSTDVMEVTDPRGLLVDVNPAFERIYGYRREEVLGRTPGVVSAGKTSRETYERMWAAILDPQVGNWQGEVVNRSRDGTERPVLLSIYAVRNEAGQVTNFMGVATDLTERKRMELHTAHMERLSALGQMAAGVAHEINTPLANIMLVAESLRRKTTDPWVRSRAETLLGQAEAASRIVRGLLEFSRPREIHLSSLDLNEVVQEAVVFLEGKQSPEVDLERDLASGPLKVRGDRHQLIQVVVNLLSNAYDAMEGHGSVRVSTRGQDGYAEVGVADTGPGIPPEIRRHLFEPFFTTKGEGKGTGLGLAICHGIVRAHGGTIEVVSEPGRGTTFTVRLPAEPADVASP